MRNRTGKPVHRDDFFARPRVVDELWHVLLRENVLLLAPRRTGKTSLMHHLMDEGRPATRFVFLDVESVDSEALFVARLIRAIYEIEPPGATWSRLATGVQAVLERIGKVNAGPVEVDLTSAIGADWREAAHTVLALLGPVEDKVVVLIDEFPKFIERLLVDDRERGELFLDWFRALRIDRALEGAEVHFLLAGSIGLDAVVARAGLSASINDLEVFRLGPLYPGEVAHFIDALCVGEALELDAESRQAMAARIDWPVPYHLQLLFSEVHRQVAFHGQTASAELVDACFERLLAPERRKHFLHWEERLRDPLASPAEQALVRRLLAAAARDPDGISSDTARQLASSIGAECPDLHVVLGALVHDGYLVPHGDRWRFASTLLRTWWLRWKVDA